MCDFGSAVAYGSDGVDLVMFARELLQNVMPEAVESSRSSRTLLRAKGIQKRFGKDEVLRGVDAELHEGEVVLLTGENGSGKTTLLNILTGNLEPDAGEIRYLADDSPRGYEFPRPRWRNLNPWDHFRPEFVAMEGIGRT
jgi:ABC-type branched-subunit amino acid transport system ATPase component